MENLIFKAIVGSQSYGTATPTSDIDHKGVYMQPVDDLISFDYKEQIEISKDEVYYEVRRFLQLLQSANPTVLELLYSPEDCIVQTSPQFERIVQNRHRFLTQKCLHSFGGYAIAQIKKAKGLDKKMNWEKDRVERKTPLDFVYAYTDGKTMPVEKWLEKNGKKQEKCGLVALDHFRDCYALYYDDNLENGQPPLGFKGIVMDDSNAVRLSAVPKGMTAETIVYYNKDGYSMHCKDYRDYETWLANRNTQRYVDIKGHNQQIDGKNLLHCRRLLDMAMEIATEKTIRVRRPNADYLLSIRRGEVELETIIEQAEKDLQQLDELFAKSGLPTDCDRDFVNELLLSIRHM
ncbi:MAG: nucleotidyltransferase domain-containing protein, partial [Cytophagales bacterium]|jgi:predicted nucleotidyltransferase|nr:nucleotidyltransferase domain-containing protein [Cytophagales bacterium]